MTLRMRIKQLIAFFFRSLLWSLNLWLVLYTCLAYWLLYSLPTQHWSAGLIMITIPAAWMLNLIVVGLWLTDRPWRSWLSGIVLLVGIGLFGSRTFGWNQIKEFEGNGIPVKIFSYNLQFMGLNNNLETYPSSPRFRRLANYIIRTDAPIKCFQELFTSKLTPEYNLLYRFRKAGYRHSVFLLPENIPKNSSVLAVGIFSIYPILQSGREVFRDPNGLVWADIKIGNDTIRVINVHLYSMGIRIGNVLEKDKMLGVKHETRGLLSALRTGFVERKTQITRLQQYVRESPYPVIVTGDFNETPYGVVYERMRRLLPNSFEEKGHGFGFTYNHLPNFIRIDHQFHDPRLSILNFETINYVTDSDHYPIVGTYVVK